MSWPETLIVAASVIYLFLGVWAHSLERKRKDLAKVAKALLDGDPVQHS